MDKEQYKIIHIGGEDLDGSWGESKTFVRENKYELVGVPLPVFLISPVIPKKNTIHPKYPWCIAEDSRITKNIETPAGRGVTVATTYRVLNIVPNKNEEEDEEKDEEQTIARNYPWLLPAQDVKMEVVRLEESMDFLWRFGKWESTDLHDSLNDLDIDTDKPENTKLNNWNYNNRPDILEERWRQKPFETTAGTKLTGTKQRNIMAISFWYYALKSWYKDEYITEFTDTVNDDDIEIAGKKYKKGEIKIIDLNMENDRWKMIDESEESLIKVSVQIQIDPKTWIRKYENVSNLFLAYPYKWKTIEPSDYPEDCKPMQPNTILEFDSKTHQPLYQENNQTDGKPIEPKLQRIYCTMYDPQPMNIGTVKTDDSEEATYQPDPQNMIQFFGTREDCLRLNSETDPIEVSEPMYLDKKGRIVWPNPETGMVDRGLAPKISGYPVELKDFTPLHLPTV
jgi:hypothetical protein